MGSDALAMLALGMLEAPPGFRLAWLLALDHTGVAGQETFATEGAPKGRIDFNDRASKAELNGAGLSGNASTQNRNVVIEAVGSARMLKWRGRFHASPDMSAEVVVHGLVIDQKPAASRDHANARDAFFSATGGPDRKING